MYGFEGCEWDGISEEAKQLVRKMVEVNPGSMSVYFMVNSEEIQCSLMPG